MSHRGSLAPGKLIEKPDKELTNDEVDAIIVAAGLDDFLTFMPEGEMRETFQAVLGNNFRMAHYEKEGDLMEFSYHGECESLHHRLALAEGLIQNASRPSTKDKSGRATKSSSI